MVVTRAVPIDAAVNRLPQIEFPTCILLTVFFVAPGTTTQSYPLVPIPAAP